MFNLIFDLRYIVATFSMLLCLLGEVISYLGLFILQLTEVLSQPSTQPHFSTRNKRTVRKESPVRGFPLNFEEFLRTTFFKNTSGGCIWRWTQRNQTTSHNIPIEQMLSLNDPFEGTRSLEVSNLHLETRGSQFESSYYTSYMQRWALCSNNPANF